MDNIGEIKSSIDQPSYYFTHGRKSECQTSSLANLAILKAMGHKAITLGDSDHQWCEALINGEVYVVDTNKIIPREEYYKMDRYILGPDYDPDWYKK